MSEFSWWLLIVGLVVGAGLTWLVLADWGRRDVEISEREVPMEAGWIAETMTDDDRPIDPATVEEILRLHRAYLSTLPPDNLFEEHEEDVATEPALPGDEQARATPADATPAEVTPEISDGTAPTGVVPSRDPRAPRTS